ncbi:hypothetical protein [Catenulispora subtropica]|uniref:Vegetative cell wall protein gp1 n=1 Tax=Catenulispora subtropica TaxID=450798 RepID=A0ABN2R1I5_9ACTN
MNGFLTEVAKKAVERWAALLALPGLLYLSTAVVAHSLRWRHALDVGRLTRQISVWAKDPNLRTVGGTMLLAAAALIGSMAAGLASSALSRVISRIWTTPGRRPPASWFAQWRRSRSRRAKEKADHPLATPEQIRSAIARADRICLIEADRPTWVGDRLRACRLRVERAYGLDLDAIWPRLWLVIPDPTRNEIVAARDAFSSAARLMAWGVLYLPLTIWWWPAALVSGAILVSAQVMTRSSTEVLSELIESAVDLHGRALATQLGRPKSDSPVSVDEGRMLTTQTRKSRWDPASPLAE